MDGRRRTELRQFQLLARDSVRRLISAALLAKDADPTQFTLWVVVGAALPPAFYAFNQVLPYSEMGAAMQAGIGRPDALPTLLADRMFFVLYSMLTSALVAALAWEALLPDASDQEVIGPLPVRARTFTAARLTGSLCVGAGFAAAVSIPASLLFAASATKHPFFGTFPTVVMGHIIATIGAGMFSFLLLIALRGLVAAVAGPRVSEKLALLLQFTCLVAIVGALFFLPGVVSWLTAALVDGGQAALMTPPVWFAAAYTWLVGPPAIATSDIAMRAVTVSLITAAMVIPLYLIPAQVVARKTRELRERSQPHRAARATAAIISMLVRDAPGRALVAFTIASLTRSPRHIFIVSAYVTAGLAVGAGRLATSGFLGPFATPAPDATVLLVPLVLMLFVVTGLRAAFAIPTDTLASWPFRLLPPPRRTARAATLAVVVAIGVVGPVLLFAAIGAANGWPLEKVLVACALDVLTGVAIAEVLFGRWAHIPFARDYAPVGDNVKSAWLAFGAAVVVIGFIGSQVQAFALRSPTATGWYAAAVGASVVAAVALRRGSAAGRVLFEADESQLETLGLSRASQ